MKLCSTLLEVGTNIQEIANIINRDLDTIFSYLCNSDIIIYSKKFKYMIIHNKIFNDLMIQAVRNI